MNVHPIFTLDAFTANQVTATTGASNSSFETFLADPQMLPPGAGPPMGFASKGTRDTSFDELSSPIIVSAFPLAWVPQSTSEAAPFPTSPPTEILQGSAAQAVGFEEPGILGAPTSGFDRPAEQAASQIRPWKAGFEIAGGHSALSSRSLDAPLPGATVHPLSSPDGQILEAVAEAVRAELANNSGQGLAVLPLEVRPENDPWSERLETPQTHLAVRNPAQRFGSCAEGLRLTTAQNGQALEVTVAAALTSEDRLRLRRALAEVAEEFGLSIGQLVLNGHAIQQTTQNTMGASYATRAG